jgi:hypothetical protein
MTEPLAWESTTPAYIKWITDSRYRKLRPAYQKWYRPICAKCGPVTITQKGSQMTDTLVERLEASANAPLAPWAREAILNGAAAIKAQSSRIAEKDEALAYAESILTAVSSAGAGEALNRVRKALSHSSDGGNNAV